MSIIKACNWSFCWSTSNSIFYFFIDLAYILILPVCKDRFTNAMIIESHEILFLSLSLSLYIYIYMLLWKQCNVPSWLSSQWLCGSSYTWTHDVPKSVSCHKAIVVITGRAHCFHDCIYITTILLLWDLSTLCAVCRGSLILYYIYIVYNKYYIHFIAECIFNHFGHKRSLWRGVTLFSSSYVVLQWQLH